MSEDIKTGPRRGTTTLLYASLLCIIIGGGLHILAWGWTLWVLVAGAVGLFAYHIMEVWLAKEGMSVRVRRLNRMGMFAAAAYLVSGGLMYDNSNWWIILYAVGTVYLLYSLLAKRT